MPSVSPFPHLRYTIRLNSKINRVWAATMPHTLVINSAVFVFSCHRQHELHGFSLFVFSPESPLHFFVLRSVDRFLQQPLFQRRTVCIPPASLMFQALCRNLFVFLYILSQLLSIRIQFCDL